MAIPTVLAQSKNYQLIAGLDRSDASAQALMFDGDFVAVSIVDLASYYNDRRYDYTSGDLDYRGYNVTHDAGTDVATWLVWKYTWSSGNLVRIEGPLTSTWDDRASAAWGT